MSETPVAPVAPATAPAVAAPAAPATPVASTTPKSAIQLIEQELINYFRQREQAIANVHAIDGAIQGTQNLLTKLRAAEAEAIAKAKSLLGSAEKGIEGVVETVKAETIKVEQEIAKEVESKVVSIDSVKKS